MSLRKMAKQLGISAAYLSCMVNGKRPWRPDLYERYRQLVNTSVNSSLQNVNNGLDGNSGAGDGIRTRDSLLGRQELYH